MPFISTRSILRHSRTLLLSLALGTAPCAMTALAQLPGQGDETRWTKNEYEAQLRLAQVYEENRDYINAHRLYERLYSERPEVMEAFEGYARSLEAQKKFTEAETVIAQQMDRLPRQMQGDYTIILARLQAKQGKKDDALRSFERAEEIYGNVEDCSALLPVAYGMADVGYKPEAIQIIGRILELDKEGSFCAGQGATLYLRLGEYGKAAVQYVKLVERGDQNLSFVQQRLAQFTQDSLSRMEMLEAFKSEIGDESKSLPSLQLLSWMFSEAKDYAGAYRVIQRIDDINGDLKQNRGYELLMFAERARAEGALSTAVAAYDEALKRLKSGPTAKHNAQFIQQAELGSIKTKEAYTFSSIVLDTNQLRQVISQYEAFASSGAPREYTLEANNRAGRLALEELFDLTVAKRNFEGAAKGGRTPSERSREAMFGLVDVAIASLKLDDARAQLDAIYETLDKRPRANDRMQRDRVTYMRALIDYYAGDFDTAIASLQMIIEDPSSDYANDAIALSNLIAESSTPAAKSSLINFAKAQLNEAAHNFDQALMMYEAILVTGASTPLADDAVIRSAEVMVKQRRYADAVEKLNHITEKMMTSPIADQAQFRLIEIVERDLKDKPRAQRLYEDFLVRFPKSLYTSEARDRARALRGDVF
ncbi:MAG TPA: tetratricopeptide repeat protein [Candidatus Kapabacteria bacterium]|nr:tetratricopeptide repeat protein [Candidatus Kapabacteria bacterium]